MSHTSTELQESESRRMSVERIVLLWPGIGASLATFCFLLGAVEPALLSNYVARLLISYGHIFT